MKTMFTFLVMAMMIINVFDYASALRHSGRVQTSRLA